MILQPIKQNWINQLTGPVRAEVLSRMNRRHYSAGELIYRAGEPGDELFLIERGNVRIYTLTEGGKELLYDIFPPDTCFGDSSVVDGGPRPHMAQAVSELHLRVLSRTDFEALWPRYPEVTLALARLQTLRARRLYGIYEQVSLSALSQRMASRLYALVQTMGDERDDGGIHFDMRITQEDIGSLVVGSRQSVNKILKQWQCSGVIELAYGSLVVRDLGILKSLAEDA
ncbi:MAG: Crp/Fnr family transcriptional regulator [Parahaliea sp.]